MENTERLKNWRNYMYAHNNHFEWIEKTCNVKCSKLGKEVANILGFVGRGIYNAPIKPKKIDWENDIFLEVFWSGQLSTFDPQRLTNLIIECNRRLVRLDIGSATVGRLRLLFHLRKKRTGSMSERLPTLEDMIDAQDELYGRIK